MYPVIVTIGVDVYQLIYMLYTTNLFCHIHFEGNVISAWIMITDNVIPVNEVFLPYRNDREGVRVDGWHARVQVRFMLQKHFSYG